MQPSELSTTPKTVGHYAIEHLLGEGHYGRVYLARDARLDRQVAIKVLRQSAEPDLDWPRVLLEARIAASLDHRYICRVYDVGEEDGFAFIAMEYVDGSSLLDALDSGPLNTLTALRYATQICEALTYAHEKGVLHGDIKASNVLINAEAEAKLADFGQAISSATSLDPQHDIWAFGVLLHRAVTGTLPAALTLSVGNTTPLPESVPTGLAAIIERCLESDPTRRYPSARQVLRDLRIEADRPISDHHTVHHTAQQPGGPPFVPRPLGQPFVQPVIPPPLGELHVQPPASSTSGANQGTLLKSRLNARQMLLMMAGSAGIIVLLLALTFAYRQTFPRRSRASRHGTAAPITGQPHPPGKTTVWLNQRTKKYHCPDSPWYGKTQDGEYSTEEKAVADGFRAAYGKACR